MSNLHPNTVMYGDIINLFSEIEPYIFDAGIASDSTGPMPIDHDSWATNLVIKSLTGKEYIEANDLVGIFSQDGKKRLDIGKAKRDEGHRSWATNLVVLKNNSVKIGENNTWTIEPVKSGDMISFYLLANDQIGGRVDIGGNGTASATHESWATRFLLKVAGRFGNVVK